MSLARFFIDTRIHRGKTLELSNDVAHHIIHGLRLRKNEKIILVDREEKEYLCDIEAVARRKVIVKAVRALDSNAESPVRIALGISLVSTSKLDMIIRHVTELGVSEIIPFQAERSQLKCHHVEKRKRRWKEIVKSASQQSGRTRLPQLHDPLPLHDLIAGNDFPLKLVSWEKEEGISLRNIYKEHRETGGIIVLVGPEGGFTEKEVEMAKKKGFLPFSLGPRILRCETAAIVSVALVQHYWGDLGIFS